MCVAVERQTEFAIVHACAVGKLLTLGDVDVRHSLNQGKILIPYAFSADGHFVGTHAHMAYGRGVNIVVEVVLKVSGFELHHGILVASDVVILLFLIVHFTEAKIFHLDGHAAASTPVDAHHAFSRTPTEVGDCIFHFLAKSGPFACVGEVGALDGSCLAIGGTEEDLQATSGCWRALVVEGEHALVVR